MALLDSEIARLRYEIGFSTLASGAEPYIGIAAVFTNVVQTYALAGAKTTSATAVTAATALTPVTLTLAAATGFEQFAQVVVDVDDRQELATVSAVSGSTIVVHLTKAHSGTYPVTVEGSESLIRSLLRRLVESEATLTGSVKSAGIARADDVEFFPSGAGASKSRIEEVRAYREYLRDELWRAVFGGSRRGGGSGRVAVY